MKPVFLALVAALALGGLARAEVVDSAPGGATIRESVVINAPAARVWAAMIRPALWWNSSHTYSGSAANLYVDLGQAGCLCEHTEHGGHVRHLSLVYLDPGHELRFEGGMGPLQTTGASGHMDWSLTEADGRTTVTWTYALGGYFPGGFVAFAPRVDGMLAEQVAGLKRYVEATPPPRRRSAR